MKPLSRPLFRYFGSKWQTSKHYPAPVYQTIVEPFAGSACYACQYPDLEIILCDLDPDVVALWDYLIHVDVEEIRALPVASLVQGQDLRDLGLSVGAVELISRWQRVGTNTCKSVSKWNNRPGLWQESVKLALIENLPRIRHWKAFCIGYQDLPNLQATWFIDPPYQHVGGYRFDKRQMDFNSLSQFCRSREGQVIVCEQQGADWLPFRPFREVTSGRTKQGGTRHKESEVIWTNDQLTHLQEAQIASAIRGELALI